MRPRSGDSQPGRDRWLVSYSDFITMLFGLFVVLYAFAKADQSKQQQVTAAIDAAFRSMGMPVAQEQNLPPNTAMSDSVVSPEDIRDDLERIRRELSGALAAQLAGHTVSISMGRDGLVISLREAGFFASGSAAPKPESLSTLRQVAVSLGRTPYDLRIEGHTDNVPIHNAGFDSNWELSSARATRIARLFLELKSVPPDRLSAAGYSEFHPVASNSTAEGRALNRRVDIIVLPRTKINFAAMPPTPDSGPWRRVTEGD